MKKQVFKYKNKKYIVRYLNLDKFNIRSLKIENKRFNKYMICINSNLDKREQNRLLHMEIKRKNKELTLSEWRKQRDILIYIQEIREKDEYIKREKEELKWFNDDKVSGFKKIMNSLNEIGKMRAMRCLVDLSGMNKYKAEHKEIVEDSNTIKREEEFKKEIYIKELEEKVKQYEYSLGTIKSNLRNVGIMIDMGLNIYCEGCN